MKQSDVMTLPDGLHRIEPGLYLRVREGGKFRNWVLKIQVKGKSIQKMIGSARKLSILQAKEQAKILRGKALSGQSLSEKVEQEDSHLSKTSMLRQSKLVRKSASGKMTKHFTSGT